MADMADIERGMYWGSATHSTTSVTPGHARASREHMRSTSNMHSEETIYPSILHNLGLRLLHRKSYVGTRCSVIEQLHLRAAIRCHSAAM
jgi:hypothetical protein